MDYLHSELKVADDEVVHVTLSGHSANVLLMDDQNFEKYKKGEAFAYHGGYYTKSPAVLKPPRPGSWHLIVDLGGKPGQVSASVSVRPAQA